MESTRDPIPSILPPEKAVELLLANLSYFKETLADIIQDKAGLDEKQKYTTIFVDNPNQSMARALWNVLTDVEKLVRELDKLNAIEKLTKARKLITKAKSVIKQFYYKYDCCIVRMSSAPHPKQLDKIPGKPNSVYVLIEEYGEMSLTHHLYYVKKDEGICEKLNLTQLLPFRDWDENLEINHPYSLTEDLSDDIYSLTGHKHCFVDEQLEEMEMVFRVTKAFLQTIYDEEDDQYRPEMLLPIIRMAIKDLPLETLLPLVKTFTSFLPRDFSIDNYLDPSRHFGFSLNKHILDGFDSIDALLLRCDKTKEKKQTKAEERVKRPTRAEIPLLPIAEVMDTLFGQIAQAKVILASIIQDEDGLDKKKKYKDIFVENPNQSMARALWNTVISIENLARNMDQLSPPVRLIKAGAIVRKTKAIVKQFIYKYDCIIVKSSSLPNLKQLDKIPGKTNCAYVCVAEEEKYRVFYIMKKEGTCLNLGLIDYNLAYFGFDEAYTISQKLNADIYQHTGHKHLYVDDQIEGMQLVFLAAKAMLQLVYDEEAQQFRHELLMPFIQQATKGIPLNAILDIVKVFIDLPEDFTIQKYLHPLNQQSMLSLNSDIRDGLKSIDYMLKYKETSKTEGKIASETKDKKPMGTGAAPGTLFANNSLSSMFQVLVTLLTEKQYKDFWHLQKKAAFGKTQTPESIHDYFKILNDPKINDNLQRFVALKAYAEKKLREYQKKEEDRSEFLIKLHEAIKAQSLDLLNALKESIDKQLLPSPSK